MRIFELHFNPKLQKDRVFDSFVYEPENIYEQNLGSLYIAGDLSKMIEPGANFLDNLAQAIKERHYNISFRSAEKALSEGLKKANEFLTEEIKKENVSWLGNLNCAVLAIKDQDLYFTKTGDIKILLLRGGEIHDIAASLELAGIEPYPLKVFSNIVSGKIAENDILFVLTKEIYGFFSQNGIFEKISNLPLIDESRLKNIIPTDLKEGGKEAKFPGMCLIISSMPGEKALARSGPILFSQDEKFSFARTIFPQIASFASQRRKNILPKVPFKFFRKKHPSRKKKNDKSFFRKIPVSSVFFSVLKTARKFLGISGKNKKAAIVGLLILILFLGFLVFQETERQKDKAQANASLSGIEEKMNRAESFLITKEEAKADSLFKEAWQEILKIESEQNADNPELKSLKESVEKQLYRLNKAEKIEEPELIFSFKDTANLNPERMVKAGQNLYFYGPSGSGVFALDINARSGKTVEFSQSPTLAAEFSGSFLVFSSPKTLFYLAQAGWIEIPLNLTSKADFSDFDSYNGNLYFLEKDGCQILSFPHTSGLTWLNPKQWITRKRPGDICLGSNSLTIDSSVWVINKENSADRYYRGEYQEAVKTDIFPEITGISAIKTELNIPYLYYLEPSQKRLFLTDKKGKIVKQFISEKFSDLKDFAISEDGKTIWVLNGLAVYQIQL